MGASAARPLARGVQRTINYTTVPAPVGGINAVDGLAAMPPTDAIYIYNMQPTEYGLTTRAGYVEWTNGLSEVRTIIPFTGTTDPDALFAVTSAGIFDVTTNGVAPISMVTFTDTGPTAGFGVYMNYTTAAEEQFVYYADEANGLFRYTAATNVWAQAPDFTGTPTPPAAADIVFIMQHKLRMWFVGRDSANVWYLEPNAVEGDATQFVLMGKYKHGGYTIGMWNWTVDGGTGVDDYLIFLSKAGDVLSYKGDDPSTVTTWSNTGSYFVTEATASRRVAAEYGGNLYLLCALGVISINDLLSGVIPDQNPHTPAYKVQKLVREEITKNPDSKVWELLIDPTENSMHINVPTRGETNGVYWQFVMDLTTKAWGIWRDVPISTSETWRGSFYFGTPTGQVFISQGSRDGDLIDGTVGEPVAFSWLTSFQDYGSPAAYKRCQLIRNAGLITGDVSITMQAVYDYDIVVNLSDPGNPTASAGSLWDLATWDNNLWPGVSGGVGAIRGASGMGTRVALAGRGTASARATLVASDVAWDAGGYL
jgi:hypothetical protein